MGTVYLIHFDQPLAHARHYIGWTVRESPLQRLRHHRRSHGARLLAVLNHLGIGYHVVRTWKRVDRAFERRLKNRKDATSLCPCCRPDLKRFRYRLHRR